MTAVLFIIILLCSMGDVIFKNIFAKGGTCTEGDNHVYNAIACFIGAPLALIGRTLSVPGGITVLLSVLYGFFMGFVAIFGIRSFKTGPVSLTSIFGSFSMVIPIAAGFVFWPESEPLTLMKIFGIVMMFAAVWFIISPGSDGKVTKQWIFNVIVYSLACGLMSTCQQVEAKLRPDESTMFLVGGYLSATFFICINLPFCNRKPGMEVTRKFFCRDNLNGLLVGILGAFNAICVMAILQPGRMESTVFYPLKVGSCLICNALVSYFLFHEKLSRKQLIGFVLGTAAILILTVLK